MKIALFGATGKVGSQLLKILLQKEVEVVALVRDRTKLKLNNNRLHLVEGDILNPSDVEKAVKEANLVISVIGHRKDSPTDLQEKGFKIISDCMNRFGIKRFVTLTGAGVFVKGDHPSLIDQLLKAVISVIDPDRLYDGEKMVAAIIASDLDWSIVRAPLITNQAYTGRYQLFEHLNALRPTLYIPCSDVANFLADIAINDRFIKQLPVVTK